MNASRPFKDAIDFDEIKSQRKDIDIVINVNRKHAIEFPDSREEMEKEITLLQDKIPVLDAMLAKEPPPPELPPRKPLIKVSGVLGEFEALRVIGYFTDREYDPATFVRQEKRELAGALLMAIAGNSSGSAVAAQTKVRLSDVCDFVRGKINGIPFHGWLGFTSAKVGDYVELVVTEQEGYYVVYAIANPELRVISMTPRCNQGIYANAKEQIFGTCCFFSVYLLFLIMANVFFIREDMFVFLEYVLPFCALMIAIFAPSTYYHSMKRPRPSIKLSEDIFTALGFPNPTEINLYLFTKKRLKEIKANFPEKDPGKDNERALPGRACFASYYYYYY
ncbi:putative type VI secretion system effector [Photorhabdus temperata]|uniref:Uncharacterized protein n=1 Tax=Photorhabdus temperata J3 TaxID=1389415 RepID=U7QRY5_PHOTE|nr:putative type VI secretion system effector [Photorhabdus temperata]ERT10739.1 hypothetical protein O185_23180 [Photorhabdus temperata J3]